jgi:hypothetical protein
MNVWPSLLSQNDPLLTKNRIEAIAEAMTLEDFEIYIFEMKEFINIVLKIAFNHLHFHQYN